jgi:hypothetical protein
MDARYRNYMEEFGDESRELDALDQSCVRPVGAPRIDS